MLRGAVGAQEQVWEEGHHISTGGLVVLCTCGSGAVLGTGGWMVCSLGRVSASGDAGWDFSAYKGDLSFLRGAETILSEDRSFQNQEAIDAASDGKREQG